MCGVVGIIDYRAKANCISDVKSMMQIISYRGPDESGIYNSRYATIGNVRLSIIDIESGQQPLSDPEGRYWIVLNGEIYNYKELREDLIRKGRKFNTKSDTEVLVQLFAEYGKDCLTKLNGQFVFAIWDKKKDEIFLARDRVGIRPLFYNINNGVFSFASEIKALFQQENVTKELVPENLSQIFTFWTAITPETAFRNIFELSPGHCLTYSRRGIETERYWQLSFENQDNNISFNDSIDKFNELFRSSIRLRLRADVEVAAYLSGGIDSNATVSYIKEIEPGILNTFSIGFDDKDFDESLYQQEAVKYLDTNHKSISCSSENIAQHFSSVIWHSETPLTRTAPTPMMMLSKMVRDNDIKVVITGEGADEILAGYNIFRETKIRRFWANDPGSALRPLLLKRIYSNIPHLRNANPNILKMFFGYKLSDTENPFYSHLIRWNNSNHIKKHFSTDIRNKISDYSVFDRLEENLPSGFNSWGNLEKAQWIEASVFMSGYLLSSQGDRMGMANSIEGRYPFLDHRLLEFCSTLPSEFKLKGLKEKYLLKELLNNRIPDKIINRPKQPYRAPISSVFLAKNAPEYVGEMLSDSFVKKVGIFDNKTKSALLKKIDRAGTASEMDNMAISAIISTHLLYNQFIEGHNNEFQRNELKNLRIIDDSV